MLKSCSSFDQFAGEDNLLGHFFVAENADQRLYDMMAQGFEPVVDARELRFAACAEDRVVVADNGQFAWYGQPFLMRKFDGADGEIVISGDDAPVLERAVEIRQKVCDCRKIGVTSRKILHVLHAQRQSFLGERALIA